MALENALRFNGPRWTILYGDYSGVERFAVNEAQALLQKFLPYTLPLHLGSDKAACEKAFASNVLVLGTPENNPLIAELVASGSVVVPDVPQSYGVAVLESPWGEAEAPEAPAVDPNAPPVNAAIAPPPPLKVIVLAGRDAYGVSYAVQDFATHCLDGHLFIDNPRKEREALDAIRPFAFSTTPAIENRGLWTWGYVIYDYRRFIDSMARLRMNMLTLWNDELPMNIDEVIAYAHSRGVQIIAGFQWGLDIPDLDPTNEEQKQYAIKQVFENYRDNYHGLGFDGIYFQTYTETYEKVKGGKRIAQLACEWVNAISAPLYDFEPGLKIQFGLHTTSIVENYTDFADLDSRITIIWEDAGGLPYHYEPVTDIRQVGFEHPVGLLTADESREYSKRLVQFRPNNTEFGICPKGWNALRWDSEFEHHTTFVLGERDPHWMAQRALERKPRWDRINSLWMTNCGVGARFYREMLACNPSQTTVTALVEDSMFECAMQPAVALLGEMLWNPNLSEHELLRRALAPRYYRW